MLYERYTQIAHTKYTVEFFFFSSFHSIDILGNIQTKFLFIQFWKTIKTVDRKISNSAIFSNCLYYLTGGCLFSFFFFVLVCVLFLCWFWKIKRKNIRIIRIGCLSIDIKTFGAKKSKYTTHTHIHTQIASYCVVCAKNHQNNKSLLYVFICGICIWNQEEVNFYGCGQFS